MNDEAYKAFHSNEFHKTFKNFVSKIWENHRKSEKSQNIFGDYMKKNQKIRKVHDNVNSLMFNPIFNNATDNDTDNSDDIRKLEKLKKNRNQLRR